MAFIEKHLKIRNFLVGHQMTLADVYLTALMIQPYQLMFEKKVRDQTLPNLTRYVNLNLQNLHFRRSFGRVLFCPKEIKPNFEIVVQKKPEQPKKE